MTLGLFLTTFMLYLATLAPSITVGDAGEFCAAGVTLGLPHSPGYPLFCLLARAFTLLIPWGSYAYRINILSAAAGAAAVTVLYRVLTAHNRESFGRAYRLASLLAAAALAAAPAFWRSAVQTEVFTLNALFAVLVAGAVLARKPLAAVFLFGLGLGNHHTLVLFGPFLVWTLWRDRTLTPRAALPLALAFAAGFSVYLYLPLRSFKNPGLDWGDPETLHNLWRVVSRADYGSLSLTVGEKLSRSASVSFQQLLRFFIALGWDFTLAGLLLGGLGWFTALRAKVRHAPALLLSWILAGPGFLLLANIPFTAEAEGILERFYVLSGVFWAFPLAWGMVWIAQRLPAQRLLLGAAAAVGLVVVGATRIPALDWRGYYLAYDYGRNILRTLAPGSVFFMDGGDDTFYSTAYLCFAEGRRPDVELHDRGGLVFKSVYGPDFRGLNREDKELRRNEAERAFLGRKPLYYSTFNRDVLPGVRLESDGFLYRPRDQGRSDTWPLLTLRGVFGSDFADYRSRALVPLYPYFAAFRAGADRLLFREYALSRWSEVGWLKTNLQVELAQEAYRELEAGRLDEATALYERLVAWYPDETAALLNLGVIMERRNRPDRAGECYREAIRRNPRYAEAYYNLAVVHWTESDWPAAVENLRRVLALNPSDERALRYLPAAEARLAAQEGRTPR